MGPPASISDEPLTSVEGEVTRGYRVASGTGGDPRFPLGTLRLQLPLFRAAVAGFEAHLGAAAYPGTINLRFPGRRVEPGPPEHRLRDVAWTEAFAPETFLLSRAWLEIGARRTPVFLYIPDPATKPDHIQRPDVVELIAGFVEGVRYGAPATLLCPSERLAVR